MAELVDALVSNTNAARRAGSIPALGTSSGERVFSLPACFLKDVKYKQTKNLWNKFRRFQSLLVFAKN